jgi:Cytochrome P450
MARPGWEGYVLISIFGLFTDSIIQVSAYGGVKLEGNVHLREGTRFGGVVDAVHHDEAFYPRPSRFDSFRFSRPREAHEAENEIAKIREHDRPVQIGQETEAITHAYWATKECRKSQRGPNLCLNRSKSSSPKLDQHWTNILDIRDWPE